MGLTKDGFKRQTYETILNEMSGMAREKFGQDANVSERASLGILLRIMAWFLSVLWQDLENTYYGGFRKSAEGKQLDMLMPSAGVERRPAEYAYGYVLFKGDPRTVVPAGFRVSTNDGVTFMTVYETAISHVGEVISEIVAVEPGARGNVEIGMITSIVNPTVGIHEVTNPSHTDHGRNEESDAELRDRANASIEGLGSGTTSSIFKEIMNVDGVRSVKIAENYTDYVDQYGTPPRAIQAFVLGGTNEDIADAIFRKKPAGIQPYGGTYVNIKDTSGQEKTVGFTRAHEQPIHLRIDVHINSQFPMDGRQQLITSIIQYIGGQDRDLKIYTGLEMGEPVIISRVAAKVLAIDGVVDASVLASSNGANFYNENVMMGLHQVAQAYPDNIEVIIHV